MIVVPTAIPDVLRIQRRVFGDDCEVLTVCDAQGAPLSSVASISSSVCWSRDWRWYVSRCGSRQSTRAR